MFLDNLHLMQGWIPKLERKLEIAAESAHPGFQCFFSAEPINGAPQVYMWPSAVMCYAKPLPTCCLPLDKFWHVCRWAASC